MRWNKRLGVSVVVLMLLTACGNKGPLVMPDEVSGQDVEKVEQELGG